LAIGCDTAGFLTGESAAKEGTENAVNPATSQEAETNAILVMFMINSPIDYEYSFQKLEMATYVSLHATKNHNTLNSSIQVKADTGNFTRGKGSQGTFEVVKIQNQVKELVFLFHCWKTVFVLGVLV
jgi:hypothetical protein